MTQLIFDACLLLEHTTRREVFSTFFKVKSFLPKPLHPGKVKLHGMDSVKINFKNQAHTQT